MKIHSHFYLRFRSRLPIACTLAAISLSVACSDDPTAEAVPRGDSLRFEIATAESWNAQPQGRAAEDAVPTVESAGVFALQGEDLPDSLFLQASVTDGIEGACVGHENSQTRATPVATATFYDSFGVLTSVYTGSWNESSCRPQYMYNVEVTKASSWTTSYYWPGSSSNIRFFAYAPYNGTGISLSAATTVGTPTIGYTVPAAVADQKDLLVAASAEMAGNTAVSAALTFKHALTAVRFVTGDVMLPGKITKITLKGVYGSASHKMGSDSWSGYGTTVNFSQTLSTETNGSADQEITPVGNTFMMLPQTLPSGASIEMVYKDNLTSTERTLTASIGGASWPIGKTVTYRISLSGVSIQPVFTVTPPSDFTYEGGSEEYKVTSCAVITQSGSSPSIVSAAWTAEFVEDDGEGGYSTISRPQWLTAFTESGSGSSGLTDAKTFTATIAAQQSVTGNTHNDALKAAAPVSGTYDLSTNGGTTGRSTANCYVVNAPGKYSFPIVYGNAIKNGATNTAAYKVTTSGEGLLTTFINHLGNGITSPYIKDNTGCNPSSAVLVWQDAKGLVQNVGINLSNQMITFEVPAATICQGNAVIAVRDASGATLWSWHIWVTDYKLGSDIKTKTNFAGTKQYKFMPVNIGWCDAEATTYAARSVKVRFTQTISGKSEVITLSQKAHSSSKIGNAPYYQWGRKDPMLPASGNTEDENKTWYNASGEASNAVAFAEWVVPEGDTSSKNIAIMNGILNPTTLNSSMFMDRAFFNLWNACRSKSSNDDVVIKTVYDPSPVGFQMPVAEAFSGFAKTTDQNSTATGTWDDSAKGINFSCVGDATLFIPAVGYRPGNSALRRVGISGFCWSATPTLPTATTGSSNGGIYMYFVKADLFIRTYQDHYRYHSLSARPVQEE